MKRLTSPSTLLCATAASLLFSSMASCTRYAGVVEPGCEVGGDGDGGCTQQENDCGAGTHLSGMTCVLDEDAGVVCGPGTHSNGNECVPDNDGGGVSCGVGTSLIDGGCVANSDAGVTCGPGTSTAGDTCVLDAGPICGPGTHDDNGTCVVNSDAGLVCGPGAYLEGTACLPDDAGADCGPGTMPSDAGCVPSSDAGLSCGQGTTEVNGVCLPVADAGASCGEGTILDAGVCVPSLQSYLIRMPTNQIISDGYTVVPIEVIGTNPDGSPATDNVILTSSVPDAASVSPSTFTLSPFGSTSELTPCDNAIDGCSGQFQLLLSPQNDPTRILAVSEVLTLVAPAPVGSLNPCLTGGNVLVFDGEPNNDVVDGEQTVHDAVWTDRADVDSLVIDVESTATAAAYFHWELAFATDQLGLPLREQVYTNATATENAGHPFFSVMGNSSCDDSSSSFQVETFDLDAGTLQAASVTFAFHCVGAPSVLTGCVRFNAADLQPTSLNYTSISLTCQVGIPCGLDAPTHLGGIVQSFSITPALPSGLSLDDSTGAIGGTPLAPMTATTFLVEATNEQGSATAQLNIEIDP